MKVRRSLLVIAMSMSVGAALTIGGAISYRQFSSVAEVSPMSPPHHAANDVEVAEGDWNCWRGPNGNAKALLATPAVEWTADRNVLWKSRIDGDGHSSPILAGNRIFVTTAVNDGSQRLLCFESENGNSVWDVELHHGALPVKHDKNTHASATAATDGRRVYTAFAVDSAIWVSAVDYDGSIVWQTEAGPFVSQRGYGSSPALFGSLLFVAADNRGAKLERLRISSFLAALDCETGEIVWRIQRPEEHSFGSPIVAELNGRAQLLLAGCSRICAYDPMSGEEIWSCESAATRTANTLAFGDGVVFSSASYPDKEVMAIRADGRGDVTGTHVLWKNERLAGDVPSPLWHAGLLYVMQDNGILTCFDGLDGTVVWRKRLAGNFSSSPALGGGHLYVSSEEGTTYVLTPGEESEVVGENSLGEAIYASPAFSGDRLFIRTSSHLWCIAEGDEDGGNPGNIEEHSADASGG